MSFFSRSRSSRNSHYKNGNYGSKHYQKKGFLGNLFNALGSRSRSDRYQNYPAQHPDYPIPNQPTVGQNAMTCTKCNAKIPAGSKFCLECGEKISDSLFCPGCGEKLPLNAKFCMKCGAKVGG